MTRIVLIRHGKTKGNLDGRYTGRTDEPLCGEGLLELKGHMKKGIYPKLEKEGILFVSPMRRCRETAEVIYPEAEQNPVEHFRECDFGEFEYKNYRELNGNPVYQRWIDSGGMLPFPGGEDPLAFRARSVRAFQQLMELHGKRPQIILIVHGGTIMSIMSALEKPETGYFEHRVGNGQGYVCELMDHGWMKVVNRIK